MKFVDICCIIVNKIIFFLGEQMFTLNIKNIRIANNLTQEELSLKSGFSQGYISYLERENFARNKSPRLETIERIAKALDVCPKEVLLTCNCKRCATK